MTTRHQREKLIEAKQRLLDENEKADGKADALVDKGISLLEKFKTEKWTAAGLFAGSAALLYLIFR